MNIEINKLPSPTMRKLKMNGTILEDVHIDSPVKFGIPKEYREITSKEVFSATGKEADELFDGMEGISISFGEIAQPYQLSVTIKEKNSGGVINLETAENSSAMLIVNYVSEEIRNGFGAFRFNARLAGNSRLHIVQIGGFDRDYSFYSNVQAQCDEGAQLLMTTVILGAGKTYLGANAALVGDSSAFDTHTAYILADGMQLDMNYVADHTGKRTLSEIKADGVMGDNTYKISRQTINFLTGCSGSKGKESEEVLLLGDHVVNKSVPLILCTEEDVEGEHGASIGQPDGDVLYYLQSRGMEEKTIYEMLSRAKIDSAASRIGFEPAKRLIRKYMGISEDDENEA